MSSMPPVVAMLYILAILFALQAAGAGPLLLWLVATALWLVRLSRG